MSMCRRVDNALMGLLVSLKKIKNPIRTAGLGFPPEQIANRESCTDRHYHSVRYIGRY